MSTNCLSVASLARPDFLPQTTKLWNGCKDPMGGPAVGLAVKQFWVTSEKKSEESILRRVLRDTEEDIRMPQWDENGC